MQSTSGTCGISKDVGLCQPQRTLQCEEQMIAVAKNVDRLNNLVGEIENRLARVVRQEPATEQKCANSPRECLVDFADGIRNQAERIFELGDRIAYLLTHMEI